MREIIEGFFHNDIWTLLVMAIGVVASYWGGYQHCKRAWMEQRKLDTEAWLSLQKEWYRDVEKWRKRAIDR